MPDSNTSPRSQRGAVPLNLLLGLGCLLALVVALATWRVESDDAPELSFDGLHLVEDAKVAIAYVEPEADFSVYDSFLMLEAYVAFKKNWQRDTRVAGRRVSNADVERIKGEVATLLHETFRKELDEKGGYAFVEKPGDSVMILRPAIIDLVITAPDIAVPGRHQSYVASSGAATLFLEMYDSVSGDILARVIDRRQVGNYGTVGWSNSVTNRADAQRMFRRWAGLLRSGLDEVRSEAGKPSMTPGG